MNRFFQCLVIAAVVLGAVVGIPAAIVGIIDTATRIGPNCPGPVPDEWLGYCADYDLR